MTKKMRFEATCTCGARITGDTLRWRHDKAPATKHRGHAIGTIKQI
jgi:hypothetical protein